MNRHEIIAGGALLLILLQACTQPEVEPIVDYNAAYEGKFGTPIPRPPSTWLECESRPGQFYKQGHEILCDEVESEGRPLESDRDTLKDWWETPREPECTMNTWQPGVQYANNKPEKECA